MRLRNVLPTPFIQKSPTSRDQPAVTDPKDMSPGLFTFVCNLVLMDHRFSLPNKTFNRNVKMSFQIVCRW